MKWNIKDHGDSVEKIAAKELDDTIVNRYNEYWGNYIGNVSGKPLEINGIDSETNRTRLFLGQCLYTLLQNLLLLNLINGIPNKIKHNEPKKLVKSLKLYLEATHILYNSVDIVEDYNKFPFVPTESKIDVLKFFSFKKFRNVLAHGFRPEVKVDHCLYVTKNFELFNDWSEGDYKIWTLDNIGEIDFWSIFDYINYLKEQNKQLLFDLLDKSIEFAENKLKDKNIGQHSTLIKLDSNIFPEISGSTRAV
jgi:hypothetical protein